LKKTFHLPYKCEQTLATADQETAEVIPNAQITLMDENMQAIEQILLMKWKNTLLRKRCIECDKDYTVRVTESMDIHQTKTTNTAEKKRKKHLLKFEEKQKTNHYRNRTTKKHLN
jgi:hypothetical protein